MPGMCSRITLSRPRPRPGPFGASRVSRVRIGIWLLFDCCSHTAATCSLWVHHISKDNKLSTTSRLTQLEAKAVAKGGRRQGQGQGQRCSSSWTVHPCYILVSPSICGAAWPIHDGRRRRPFNDAHSFIRPSGTTSTANSGGVASNSSTSKAARRLGLGDSGGAASKILGWLKQYWLGRRRVRKEWPPSAAAVRGSIPGM